MRVNLRKMIVVLAAIAFAGAGSAIAARPTPPSELSEYLSARASTLLAEVQKEAVELNRHAETLGTFAWNPLFSWESHASYLGLVKSHINAIGERTAELQQISYATLPWQQQAIAEVTAHAVQVAANTQTAIAYLRENQDRLFASEYRGYLTTIAGRSDDMKQTVDKFLDYEKAQQKFQQLRNELELSAG